MATRRCVPTCFRPRLCCEQLESRHVLTTLQPKAVEQLFLERLNDIRENPAAYGSRIGLDLSAVAPAQPLAFNTALIAAARNFAQDMNNRGYFDHVSPEGADASTRIAIAGYDWFSWGESLAGGTAYPGPEEAIQALIIDNGVSDLGHRRHLLATDQVFKGQSEAGVGIVQSGTGPLVNYQVLETASGPAPKSFLTGVVIRDQNHNDKFDIGEGLSGVTITAQGIRSTTTFDSGGYSLQLAPGPYTITASGGDLPAPITRTIVMGSSNYRLTFTTTGVVQPIPPTPESYVAHLYETILGRTATTPEIAPWANVYRGAAGSEGVVRGIEQSTEARGRIVQTWYSTYLGRAPGSGELQFWVNGMLKGAREEDILSGILGSQEYQQRAQARTDSSEAAFVAALYTQLLNRTASANELAGWVSAVRQAGQAAVALGFLQSTEFRANVVRSYYAGLLKRTTAPTTAEVAGWATSPLSLSLLRQAFEASREFFAKS